MRIAILGRTHWLLNSAVRLHQEEGFSIAFVATAAAPSEYRAKEGDFEAFASEVGATFLNRLNANDEEFQAALSAANVDVAISINWPAIIGRPTCEIPRHGILNAHAGDLPRYRGNACPNWAIINGEDHVGLCIHQMDPEVVDAGPVYTRRNYAIDDATYIGDIYAWMDDTIPGAFCEALKNLSNPAFSPQDQAETGTRPLRCQPRRPEDGLIDWSKDAREICRLVRASSRPFAGAFTYLEGRERVAVWRAQAITPDYDLVAVAGQIIGRTPQKNVLVACGKGILEIQESEMVDQKKLPGSNTFRLMNRSDAQR